MCIIGNRVKELIEANNREVERRRLAEYEAELLRGTLRAVQESHVRLEEQLRVALDPRERERERAEEG